MSKEKNREIELPSLDELFSSQEERDDAKLRRIEEIPLDKIDPFPEHPYKVRDDEDMINLVESVKANGVITPATVRKKRDGRYEIISGHRRKRACELAGFKTLRAEVVEMNRNEAIVFMVESNFQRSKILPSEKGFAYKMRLEAIMRERKNIQDRAREAGEPLSNEQIRAMSPLGKDYITTDSGAASGKTRDILMPHNATGNIPSNGFGPLGQKYSRDKLADEVADSARQIQRYIRLTELIEPLRDKVDEGFIALRPAVELSYLTPTEQNQLNELIEIEQATPTHAQAIRIRKLSAEGKLTEDTIETVMLEKKPNQKEKIVLRGSRVAALFPENLPVTKREDYVVAAMEHYGKFLAKKERNQER
ncbi:MAG: ParB/RepB/Spo0J family partition protein [Lentihominibacter sp.]